MGVRASLDSGGIDRLWRRKVSLTSRVALALLVASPLDKTPVWNEKFTFAVVDAQLDQLVIEVKDKNFTSRCGVLLSCKTMSPLSR
jgi:hypothetical protein